MIALTISLTTRFGKVYWFDFIPMDDGFPDLITRCSTDRDSSLTTCSGPKVSRKSLCLPPELHRGVRRGRGEGRVSLTAATAN